MKIYIAGKITGDPGYLDKFRGEASCKRSTAAAWDDTKITNGRVCTSCGAGVFKDIFFRGGRMNYCPNCGKQMRNA